MWRFLKILGLLAITLLAVIQFIPYGRDHSNPPVVAEPTWDSPTTRTLAVRACFDCHSNQTQWPWYSHVAPMSWLVQGHVDGGRAALNFSEWGRGEMEDAAESVLAGEMPPRSYTLLHREAALTQDERRLLASGLTRIAGRGESTNPGERDDD